MNINTIKVINQLEKELRLIYCMNGRILDYEHGKCLMLSNKSFGIAFTSTTVYDEEMIKIEHIYAKDHAKDFEETILRKVIKICSENDIAVGAWVLQGEKKLYEKVGFKFRERKDDDWYEYRKEGV